MENISWAQITFLGPESRAQVAGLPLEVAARVNSCSEPDVLPLGNGTILAACRFQNDPCSLIYYSNAGISVSHDRGATWSVTGLLTGWAQQDGSLSHGRYCHLDSTHYILYE